MVKRLVAAAIMALVVMAAPAGAQQYPPAQNSLTISDTTPTAGQTVTIGAQTFEAGTSVTFTMFSQPVVLATASSDTSGVVSTSATIPANATLGEHTLQATGTGSDGAPLTLTLTFTVVAADGSTGGASGGLPRTGDDSSLPLARIGLGLVAAGGVVTAVAAKRRKATAAV